MWEVWGVCGVLCVPRSRNELARKRITEYFGNSVLNLKSHPSIKSINDPDMMIA